MSRRRRGRNVHGVILLDKPAGMSSNQALQKVRHLLGARKGGHTGSLDPFATGMLPLCFGEASKTAAFMLDADKTYRATLRLGEATTTGDPEGECIERMPVPDMDTAGLDLVLRGFEGESMQVPPMYSALKHEGRPLYELARRGEVVERKARPIRIHRLTLLEWSPPLLEFEVHCTKGTYVRTLAEGIARKLGSCGHLVALRRLRVGGFDPSQMRDMGELVRRAGSGTLDDCLLPVDAGLGDWMCVALDAGQAARFLHGNPVELGEHPPGHARIFGPDGNLLGLGEVLSGGRLRPNRVFVFD